MAFIKEKERKSLIAKINQSYAFRKFLICIEIVALIGFIIVTFLSVKYVGEGNKSWAWFIDNKVQPLGIGMIIYAVIILILGIISVALTLTLKSPKKVKQEIDKLQSSALSGKRVYKNATSQDVNRSRTTVKEKKK